MLDHHSPVFFHDRLSEIHFIRIFGQNIISAHKRYTDRVLCMAQDIGQEGTLSFHDVRGCTVPMKPVSTRISQGMTDSCNKCYGNCVFDGLDIGNGIKYHPDCLTCASCDIHIKVEEEFCVKDNTPFCNPCGMQLFGKICAVCMEVIHGSYRTAEGLNYHLEHFWCFECKLPFDDGSYFLLPDNEGVMHPYCEIHYDDLCTAKCAGCNKEVLREGYLIHEGTWHPKCLLCSECEKVLVDEDGPLECVVSEGKIYCPDHVPNAPKCPECGLASMAGNVVDVDGRGENVYHEEHLVCRKCRTHLKDSPLAQAEGHIYCMTCVSALPLPANQKPRAVVAPQAQRAVSAVDVVVNEEAAAAAAAEAKAKAEAEEKAADPGAAAEAAAADPAPAAVIETVWEEEAEGGGGGEGALPSPGGGGRSTFGKGESKGALGTPPAPPPPLSKTGRKSSVLSQPEVRQATITRSAGENKASIPPGDVTRGGSSVGDSTDRDSMGSVTAHVSFAYSSDRGSGAGSIDTSTARGSAASSIANPSRGSAAGSIATSTGWGSASSSIANSSRGSAAGSVATSIARGSAASTIANSSRGSGVGSIATSIARGSAASTFADSSRGSGVGSIATSIARGSAASTFADCRGSATGSIVTFIGRDSTPGSVCTYTDQASVATSHARGSAASYIANSIGRDSTPGSVCTYTDEASVATSHARGSAASYIANSIGRDSMASSVCTYTDQASVATSTGRGSASSVLGSSIGHASISGGHASAGCYRSTGHVSLGSVASPKSPGRSVGTFNGGGSKGTFTGSDSSVSGVHGTSTAGGPSGRSSLDTIAGGGASSIAAQAGASTAAQDGASTAAQDGASTAAQAGASTADEVGTSSMVAQDGASSGGASPDVDQGSVSAERGSSKASEVISTGSTTGSKRHDSTSTASSAGAAVSRGSGASAGSTAAEEAAPSDAAAAVPEPSSPSRTPSLSNKAISAAVSVASRVAAFSKKKRRNEASKQPSPPGKTLLSWSRGSSRSSSRSNSRSNSTASSADIPPPPPPTTPPAAGAGAGAGSAAPNVATDRNSPLSKHASYASIPIPEDDELGSFDSRPLRQIGSTNNLKSPHHLFKTFSASSIEIPMDSSDHPLRRHLSPSQARRRRFYGHSRSSSAGGLLVPSVASACKGNTFAALGVRQRTGTSGPGLNREASARDGQGVLYVQRPVAVRRASEKLSPPSIAKFSLVELLRPSSALPGFIAPHEKEKFMSDVEFEKVFLVDKASFYALPKWRQQAMKKKIGLF